MTMHFGKFRVRMTVCSQTHRLINEGETFLLEPRDFVEYNAIANATNYIM